jgi:hypothetical protein
MRKWPNGSSGNVETGSGAAIRRCGAAFSMWSLLAQIWVRGEGSVRYECGQFVTETIAPAQNGINHVNPKVQLIIVPANTRQYTDRQIGCVGNIRK